MVTFHYRLSDQNDQLLEDSYDGDPMACLYGYNGIIAGLEKSMMGRGPGEIFKVIVQPADGYGLRNESLKQRIPIKHLHVKKKARLHPGQIVTVDTEQGHRQVTILKVGKFNVDVDSNHPFAGKVLNFEIEILDVRSATSEELAHGHAHGVGGHHH